MQPLAAGAPGVAPADIVEKGVALVVSATTMVKGRDAREEQGPAEAAGAVGGAVAITRCPESE